MPRDTNLQKAWEKTIVFSMECFRKVFDHIYSRDNGECNYECPNTEEDEKEEDSKRTPTYVHLHVP